MLRLRNKHLKYDFDLIVARNTQQIETIRPVWQAMQKREPYPTINADIDRFLSVIEASSNNAQPHVILLKQNNQPTAMVIARSERHPVPLRLGYKTLLNPKLRCLTIVYGGILGQPDGSICTLLINELMNILHRREADMVFFNYLRTNTSFYQLVRKMPNLLSRNYFTRVEPHWSMSIPEDISLFYRARSHKHRKHLKQYIRKLERSFPSQVKMATYTCETELHEAIKVASQISSKTYQHTLGCGFDDNHRTRSLLKTAANLGWFRGYVLFVCGEPCAYRFGLHYSRTLFASGTGFDPKWKHFRVGTVLFLKVLESLCNDKMIDHYDFGYGDAEYKRSYADTQWQEACISIFAPRLLPIIVNVLRTSMTGLHLSLEYTLKRTTLADWAKRRWRNSLEQST